MKLKRKLQEKFNNITTIFVCCILFCLACFVGTFSYVPEALVMAAKWDSITPDTSFISTGNGTTNNPYKISTATQLATIAKNIGEYYNKSFKLTSNIDVSQNDWVPIGNNVNKYSGIFDGDGHSISGLRIDASATDGYTYAGLFGYLSGATIKNLTLGGGINSYVFAQTSGSVFAGALAGYAEVSNITNILNFDVDVRCVSTTSSSYAGGIVGYAVRTNFERVINFGNVTSYVEKNTYNAWAGGIVGYFSTSQANYIKYARNDGTINSLCYGSFNSIRTYAGGIVGTCKNNGSLAPSVSLSYNTGEIYSGISGVFTTIGSTNYTSSLATQSYAGGIVGQSDIVINDTYNLGKVTANAIQKTISATTEILGNKFLYEVQVNGDMKMEGYYNSDLSGKHTLKHGQTKYYDTPAYAGGIAGYSSLLINNSYNDGQIFGGKKIQELVIANTISSHWDYWYYMYIKGTIKYVLFCNFQFTSARYYSDINGNITETKMESYGAKVTNDFSRTVTISGFYDYSGVGLNNTNVIGQKKSTLSNETLTQNFTIEDDWLGRFVDGISYNISINSSGGVLKLNVYMNFDYTYYTYGFWAWEVYGHSGNAVALNISNYTLSQRINNHSISATSVSANSLGTTHWAKESDKNGNKPFLKEFYW